ncbi:hypothetical protein LWE61_03885 [Sphingobium sufflavum]|uniref:hypothetical protein n=1 Tax=Sphingobium sufflavum TaxID=1129547 RepID=UPI001F1D6F20|nr:hypothetical protein [Sphingobium sufflavum]MCE7795695.1 hypothetical protein [Sphingobium sufflavum]
MSDEASKEDEARLTGMTIQRIGDGAPGYRLDNPFGQSVQVLPTPPTFSATVTLHWEGAMPDEIIALLERARAAGLSVEDHP